MKKLILFFFILFASLLVKASECYNYHTSKTTKLIIKGGSLYFQFTEKDQNGFSYVTQYNKLLRGIDVKSYKLYGEDEDAFIFADKTGIYSLNKQDQYEGEGARVYKILNVNESVKNINGRLFLIDGKWTYLHSWREKVTKIIVKDLPVNILNVKAYSSGLYVKDDKNVYALEFDLNEAKKYQITILGGLSPSETVYYSCAINNNADYLADKNTMFCIRRDGGFEEITPQLLALGFRTGFNTMKLLDPAISLWQAGELILKKRDGASSSFINPLNGEEIGVEYAYSAAKLLMPLSVKVAMYHLEVRFIQYGMMILAFPIK